MKTNLSNIKDVAYDFLNIDVTPNESFPFLVWHPYFEQAIMPVKSDNGGMEFVNILESEENLNRAKARIRDCIDEANDVNRIICIVRKSYRLTFLKYIKDFLTKTEFSRIFGELWIMSENPNGDVNVPISLSAQWFRECDKKALMEKKEYEEYVNLPDKFTVYRGVAFRSNPKGMSFTRDYEKAKWFAHRFDRENETGYIISKTVNKDEVLAFFSRRDEEEVVIYPLDRRMREEVSV